MRGESPGTGETIAVILVGVLGSYPLWPGINAETGEAIKVGLFG